MQILSNQDIILILMYFRVNHQPTTDTFKVEKYWIIIKTGKILALNNFNSYTLCQ